MLSHQAPPPARDIEPVNLFSQEVLSHPGQPITHVYSPNRGMVSVVSVFEDGQTVEAAGADARVQLHDARLAPPSTPVRAIRPWCLDLAKRRSPLSRVLTGLKGLAVED
jgi:hypothetical protein